MMHQGPWAAAKQLWRARVTNWDSVLGAGLMREELCARLGVRACVRASGIRSSSHLPSPFLINPSHTHHKFLPTPSYHCRFSPTPNRLPLIRPITPTTTKHTCYPPQQARQLWATMPDGARLDCCLVPTQRVHPATGVGLCMH